MPYLTPDEHQEGYIGALCIPLPTNERYRAALIGAITSLTKWHVWQRDERQSAAIAADFFKRLYEDITPCNAHPEPEVLKTIEYIYRTIQDPNQDESDETSMPQYQKFNGVWYIGLHCGDCGEIDWIPLGTAANLDPSTNAPVPPEQIATGIITTSEANTPCYATASVDYLLNRFRQWLNFSLGTATTAIDESFSVFDDVVSIAAQFLSKSDERSLWDALIELGEDDIYAQVAVHRTAMINAYNLRGTITASQVQKLFTDQTGTWTLPGQAVILWIKTSKLLGITKDLANLAQDCESNNGTSQLAPLLPALPVVPTTRQWAGSNATFTILKFELNTLGIGDSWQYKALSNIVGIGAEFTATPAGNPFASNVTVQTSVDSNIWFSDAYSAEGATHKIARVIGDETQDALESVWTPDNYTGDTTFYQVDGTPGIAVPAANHANVTGIGSVTLYVVTYEL